MYNWGTLLYHHQHRHRDYVSEWCLHDALVSVLTRHHAAAGGAADGAEAPSADVYVDHDQDRHLVGKWLCTMPGAV